MLDDTPVWIITYENVELHGHGPGVGSFMSHWNQVVNAETGELISHYSAGTESAVLNGAD